MVKTLLILSLVVCGTCSAGSLYVIGSGTFSATDTADTFVTPNDAFSVEFLVPTNPTLTPGEYNSLSFDVPVSGFTYELNGIVDSVPSPTEITFYTAADGGGFEVDFGPSTEFLFGSSQIFSGTTAAPVFSAGEFSGQTFLFLDNNNVDANAATVAVTPTPEPSSILLLLLGGIGLFAIGARKSAKPPLALLAGAIACFAQAPQVPITPSINVPNTGQVITPQAAAGSRFTYLNPHLANYPTDAVEFAVSAAVSPDNKTLALITSGDYGIYTPAGAKDTAASTEWIFIFDISHAIPVQKQAIQVTNTYSGLVFDPGGTALYVSGGRNDSMHIYTVSGGVWSESASSPIALGHVAGLGSGTPPEAAGIAISSDGTKIVIANYENDSVSVLQNTSGTWSHVGELDLRPNTAGTLNPNGTFGGEYPFWVAIANNNTAYVSTMRDREIDVVNISSPAAPSITTRIPTTGQPLKSTLDAAQAYLYVAEDQSDEVAVISTATNTKIAELKVVGPASVYPASLANLSGNNTNSVALSPDGNTLYVTNGTTNDVAVVNVAALKSNSGNPVAGLIPTGQYPTQAIVTGSGAGQYMYVLNAKSPSGPNVNHCHGSDMSLGGETTASCNASDQYTLQLTKAGLQFLLVPSAGQLAALTAQVAVNDNFSFSESAATATTMNFLAANIKHVVYIIRENRTYDQVLGDLPIGNGDPSLVEFGSAITPNGHFIASNFVDLDNFFDTSEVSYDGWSWSTSAMGPDILIRQTAVNYSFRSGVAYESEGDLRGINLNYRPGSLAANVVPGVIDTDAPDGPGNAINGGYLWNAAFNAGLSFREYGADGDAVGSAIAWPASIGVQQTNPSFALLNNSTNYDVDFRAYDLNEDDTYRYQEWNYDVFTRLGGNLPALSILRFPHDHTGSYSTNPNTVNYTPEGEVADNDFAVGKVIQDIANSPTLKTNTLVFVIEDDAQNGGDHVDAHRSTAYIVGPYVKQGGTVVHTQYNTINFVRTIERVLGLSPNHITDALAQPMADVFDTTLNPSDWSFTAQAASILYTTELASENPAILPPLTGGLIVPKPAHGGEYWAKVTKGLNFSQADRVDPVQYNRILWRGLKGDVIYPGDSSLAETRRRYKEALKMRTAVVKDE
jgi:YVTN family beta-propeller protein